MSDALSPRHAWFPEPPTGSHKSVRASWRTVKPGKASSEHSPGSTFVAEFISPPNKCKLSVSYGGHIIQKSVKCTHSTTKPHADNSICTIRRSRGYIHQREPADVMHTGSYRGRGHTNGHSCTLPALSDTLHRIRQHSNTPIFRTTLCRRNSIRLEWSLSSFAWNSYATLPSRQAETIRSEGSVLARRQPGL